MSYAQKEFVLKQSASDHQTKEDERRAEDDFLYRHLSDSKLKVNLVKHRDRYVSFSAVAKFEKQLDEILTGYVGNRSDPDEVKQVYLVSPSFKTLSIHKMLHNQVYIQEKGNPKQWSGFNIDFEQRLQYVDVRKFINYLWCDQLLNVTGFGDKVCRFKLEKYVKGILSNLNCLSCTDASMLEKTIEHVKSRYVNELDMVISESLNTFMSLFNLNSVFKLYLEWDMVLGAVPVRQVNLTDTDSLNRVKQTKTCFSTATLHRLLTVCNIIPTIEEVAVILCRDEIECWHLPTKEKLQLFGTCKLRVENKEICLGSVGESLYYAEMKLMHLNEKHFEFLNTPRYVLTEGCKDVSKSETTSTNKTENTDAEQSPLFATLTKSQTALFDENNPLSKYSRIREKNQNMKEYLSRVSSEMDDIQDKMNAFLDHISPSNANTIVDEMVQMGMENYLKKIKPKMEDWERTIRDHLNKFRMHAVKQLAALPKGLYEYQEQAAELNVNNEMDIQDFIDELSSTNVTKNVKVPNISHLEDISKSESELKQMQEKVNQYFDLATKFMSYLRDAQKVISKLRVDDSLKELQVKVLMDQKKEIVKLATKYREISNSRLETYKEQLKSLKRQLESYVEYQTQTTEKTKQHFLSIRDTILTQKGEWIDSFQKKRDKREERLKLLEEGFSKRFDSMANHFDVEPSLEHEVIKVEGTVRKANLERRIDDNTLMMYRDMLKQIWKGTLNNLVRIQETVTKTGVQLYNVDDEHTFHQYMYAFFQILYNRSFFVKCRSLEECAQIYGIYIALEVAVKKIVKLPSELKTTTIVKQTTLDDSSEDKTGLVFEN